MSLHVRHVKGFNGRLRGSLQGHPAEPGRFFYTHSSCITAVFNQDPSRQVQLRGHDDEITALAVSHTGGLVASGQKGRNADVMVWDAASLSIKLRFEEHDAGIAAVGFSHDDRLLATVGDEKDKKMFVIDTTTGKIVAKNIFTESLSYKTTSALTWSTQAGNCYCFATAMDTDVYIWSVDPFKGWVIPEKVVSGNVRRVITCLAFSAAGDWLYAGTTSGDVITINVQRRAMQLLHPICTGAVGALHLIPGTSQLLVGAGDGSIIMFSCPGAGAAGVAGSTGHVQQGAAAGGSSTVLARVGDGVTSLSLLAGGPHGRSFLAGTAGGSIYRLDLDSSGRAAVSPPLMQTQQGPLTSLSYADHMPGAVATGCQNGTIAVWDTQDYSLQLWASEPRAGAVLSLSMGPDQLVSGWEDGTVRCHARQGDRPGTLLWTVANAHSLAHSCGVTAVQLSNRHHFVASGGAGGELRVWDAASREMVSHMKHHTMAITDLKVLLNDSHLLAASEDRTWSIWDMHQEKLRNVFQADMGAVRGVALAPDQVSVVSVGLNRNIHIWDVRQTAPIRVIKDAHASEVTCVAVNPRGTLIATGGFDASVRLWDFGSGSMLGSWAGHTGPVRKVSFSPDDNQMASVGKDGSLVLWKTS